MSFTRKIYLYLRSVKLALGLIILISVTIALETLVPQGRESSFYIKMFPPFLSGTILFLKYDTFFRSFIFILPAGLFFINLSTCTFHRLYSRIKLKARKRFGPDIIHLGLLLLMIGGLITLVKGEENLIYMSKGDSVTLPGDGYTLKLNSFKYLTYPDKRPKAWLSDVDIIKDNAVVRNFVIKVNRPLKVAKLRIYQYNYKDNSDVIIADEAGNTGIIHPGSYFKNNNQTIMLRKVDIPDASDSNTAYQKAAAIFEIWQGGTLIEKFKLNVGGVLENITIKKINYKMATGLKIVKDPGVLPVMFSLIMIGLGLILTFVQKFGDNKV